MYLNLSTRHDELLTGTVAEYQELPLLPLVDQSVVYVDPPLFEPGSCTVPMGDPYMWY